MQTFLPFEDFFQSLACLDYRRLGKQRTEAFQILIANGNNWALKERQRRIDQGLAENRKLKNGWKNHKASVMWRGHDEALGLYMNIAIAEWILRGYKNTMLPMPVFNESESIFLDGPKLLSREKLGKYFADLQANIEMPYWLGLPDFHASHRSNLLRKKPEHFSQFGWTESFDLEYVWPTQRKVLLKL